nr:hypothetical protein [uncultured Agathobacter sp.]
MSRRVKSLDEISESRILFDKNPPAFGYILVTVVAAFLIVAVVWSIKTPKVYTIQAQGYLEAYVSTSDMARMHEGDKVQVELY